MQVRMFARLPRHQRGAAALVVTMLLLFASSIVVFYLNRGLIFEQKTSANQVRSTSAFEVAEAGLEWATGMLNYPFDITTDCSLLSTTNVSYRTKYIQTGATTNVLSTTNTFPGCKINGTALTCSCPNLAAAGSEAVASLGTAVQPSFTITFADVGDATAVRVTATGCTAQAGACKPLTALSAATTGNSDAWAQVSAILKLRPLLRAAPSAALTCGTSCAPGGSYNIINTDVASNGYVIDAGTTITSGGGTSYTTIPGQPVQNAIIANDASLNALASADTSSCSGSTMFKTYFGVAIADYAASPQVKTITCPSDCTSAIDSALADGWKSFYFPAGFSYHGNGTIGAPGAGNGVNFVSAGNADINGNATLYGQIFANEALLNDLGTGNSTIIGAVVSCRAMTSTGNGTIQYDSNALGGTGLKPGVMARVPGSWRDF
jgi:Tfp pilus assembly protein PilX